LSGEKVKSGSVGPMSGMGRDGDTSESAAPPPAAAPPVEPLVMCAARFGLCLQK